MGEAERAYERALWFLEKRSRTEKEVFDKLTGAGFSFEIVSDVADRLRDAGLLNDLNYAESYLETLTSKGRGRLRIAAEMRQKGLPDELVRNVLEDGVSPEDERGRALDAARRVMASAGEGMDAGKLAAKVSRKLVSLGYTYSTIGDVMRELRRSEEDEDG